WCSTAAAARRSFDQMVIRYESRRLDVEAVMRAALGGKQFASIPDDLFEQRDPKRAPQTLTIREGDAWFTRSNDCDQRVRQDWRVATKGKELFACRDEHRRRESHSFGTPPLGKCLDGVLSERHATAKPSAKNRRARGGLNRREKRRP